MLIDAFTYWKEDDMLEARLRLLSPLVDKFVIVESDRTFAGKEKPYHSEFWGNRFDAWRDKMIVHRVKADIEGLDFTLKPQTYDPTDAFWKIENQQREAITGACAGFSDDDRVMVGDLDEIPSREAVTMLKEQNFSGTATFRMFFFYYDLSCLRDEVWAGTVWAPMKALKLFGAQKLRDARGQTGFNVDRGGWHMSYFFDAQAIKEKIENFAHQEFNTSEFTLVERIEQCIVNGDDLFNRPVASRQPPEDFFPKYFTDAVPGRWSGA